MNEYNLVHTSMQVPFLERKMEELLYSMPSYFYALVAKNE
jgi:hypothetical protein